MKNLFLLTLISILMFSCETTVVEGVKLGPAPGYLVAQDGSKIDARDADPSNLAIWEKYIEAHNNRDIETIRKMDSDTILVVGPDGSRFNGVDEHINFLDTWFSMADPKWEIYWSMPYKGVKGGAEWVIAGHSVTLMEGESEVKKNQMIDAFIKDDKIQLFYVYQMDVPSEATEE